MSGYWMKPQLPSNPTFAGGTADFGELVKADYDAMVLDDSLVSSIAAQERAYDDTIFEIKQLTGQALVNPYRKTGMPETAELARLNAANAGGETTNLLAIRHSIFSERVSELAREHPGHREALLKAGDIKNKAERLARQAGERAAEAGATRGFGVRLAAGLTGGLAGAVRDPIQLYALTLGGGPGAAKTVAGRILTASLSEAAVNSAVTLAMQPAVQAWRKQAGLPNGIDEAARNMIFAGALGGVFGAGGRSLGEVLDLSRGSVVKGIPDDVPEGARAVVETLPAPARGAIDALETERFDGSAELTTDPAAHEAAMIAALKRAEQPDEIDPLPVEAGFTPSQLRGLLDQEDEQVLGMWIAAKSWDEGGSDAHKSYMKRVISNLEKDGLWRLRNEGEVAQRLSEIRRGPYAIKATRPEIIDIKVNDVGTPRPILPPRGVDDPAAPETAQAADDLIAGLTGVGREAGEVAPADDAALQSRATALADEAPEMIDTASLKIDAKTFQFKEGGDAAGVTQRLAGVEKWQRENASVILVWEAKDGSRFVADGHQRIGLARRLSAAGGEAIKIPAYVFREAEGFTAADTRIIAALKNIGENSGTPIDAAKILRAGVTGERLKALPKTGAFARDMQGLSGLSDDAFAMAVNELVDVPVAAAVGRLAPDPALHAQMIEALKREGARGVSEAEGMIRDMLAVAVKAERQDTLFGEAETSRMLLKERAAVRAAAMNRLKKDKQVFSTLTREADLASEEGNILRSDANARRADADARLIEIIEKLGNRAGPIADAFNAAAREVAGGASAGTAARGFVGAVRTEIESAGGDLGRLGSQGPAIGAIGPDLVVPLAARQDEAGQLVADTQTLAETVADADNLALFADLVRSCKT